MNITKLITPKHVTGNIYKDTLSSLRKVTDACIVHQNQIVKGNNVNLHKDLLSQCKQEAIKLMDIFDKESMRIKLQK